MNRVRRKRRNKALYKYTIMVHVVIVVSLMFSVLFAQHKAVAEDRSGASAGIAIIKPSSTDDAKADVSYGITKLETIEPAVQEPTYDVSEPSFPKFAYSKDWGAHDSYLLAKIAMAEAESCDTYTKTLVILVVLNRVWSDDFPNTIEDVIYQEVNGVHQFTPIADGRWDSVEPDDDSWNAVQQVLKAAYDYSEGALYFESCANADNWHSNNLEFLYESCGMRFYK